MKSALRVLILLSVALSLQAAPPLFHSPSQSKWTLSKGPAALGTVTLLTSPAGTRAEFRPNAGAVVTLLGGNGSVWVRASGGDIELSTVDSARPESTVLASLLLPFTTAKSDAVETKGGSVSRYRFREATAVYSADSKGPSRVDVDLAGQKYSLTRVSLSTSTADPATFVIRPKKSATSRLARLSGDLLGPSDSSISATAGGRGAGTSGLKLKDGGDYAAVERLEKRDAAWKARLDQALTEFQKSGLVGKTRGDF